MPPLDHFPWINGKFLGITWTVWKVVGWMGNAVFGSRFFVQWYATEKRKQVVVPALFWWLSIAGSLLLLAYALILQARFGLHFRLRLHVDTLHPQPDHPSSARKGATACAQCGLLSPPAASYCSQCGAKLAGALFYFLKA
jgi:uncharacterized paraquat-inducible protein A